MPQLAIHDMNGDRTAELAVSDALLGLPFNADLVHQAVLAVDAQRKRRCGKAKTRGEVDMTTMKMYRQKGLGRARHGARSAPNFVGGGQAHGPKGVQRSFKMPKRMRRLAVLTALSQQVRDGRVTLVDRLGMDEISTKRFVQVLSDLNIAEGRLLVLVGAAEAQDRALYLSSRNIPQLVMREVPNFNTRDILWAERIIVTQAALDQMMGGGPEDAES
jgi:large subunit ribosomal protein L4